MLRKMVKNGYAQQDGTYKYVKSNEAILKICGAECVGEFITRQQKKYVSHIIRMDDKRLAKRILLNNNASQRPGRLVDLISNVTAAAGCTADELFTDSLKRLF